MQDNMTVPKLKIFNYLTNPRFFYNQFNEWRETNILLKDEY